MNRIIFLLFFSFLIYLSDASSQTNNRQTNPDVLIKKALQLKEEGKLIESNMLYWEALQLKDHSNNEMAFFETGIQLATEIKNQRAPEKALQIFKILQSKAHEQLGKSHALSAEIAHQMGITYFLQHDFEKAIVQYQQAADIRLEVFGKNTPELAQSYHNLGVTHRYNGNYTQATSFFKQAITIRENINVPGKLGHSNNQLAKIIEESGNALQAIGQYELARQIYLESLPEHEYFFVADVHKDIARNYFKTQQFDQAKLHYQDAIKVYTALFGEKDFEVANCLLHLAEIENKQEAYDQAYAYQKKAISILEETQKEILPERVLAYSQFAATALLQENFTHSRELVDKAIEFGQTVYPTKHYDLAAIYKTKADLYFHKKNEDQALAFYQKALIYCYANFTDSSVFVNPKREEHTLLADPSLVLEIVAAKAHIFSKNQSPENLKNAYASYQWAVDHIQEVCTEKDPIEGLAFFEKEGVPIFEKAIQTLRKLDSSASSNPNTINQIWQLAEQSKRIRMLLAYRRLAIVETTKDQQKLILEEQNLQREIVFANCKLTDLTRNAPKASERILALKTQIKNLQLAAKEKKAKLKEKNPGYYAAKYGSKIDHFDHLFNTIDTQTAIIELFWGKEELVIFQLLESGSSIHAIPITETFLKRIEALKINSLNPLSLTDKQNFIEPAFQLYSALFPKPLPHAIKRLIIIPDGQFVYFPFSMMIQTLPQGDLSSASLDFMIKKYGLSYGYLASNYVSYKTSKFWEMDTDLLAVSPNYEQSDRFAPTARSNSEMSFLQKEFKADMIRGIEATKGNFEEVMKRHDVIHFTNLAYFSDTLYQAPYLVFNPTKPNEEVADFILDIQAIAMLNIKANMLVCTGSSIGNNVAKDPDGLMRFSQAISLSGCNSLVANLWPVNNTFGKEIIERFYHYLAEEMPKDLALQQAKLDYLNNPKIDGLHKHPFYWAGIIAIGDLQSLKLEFKIKNYIGLMLVLLSIFLLIGWLMIRKGKTPTISHPPIS